MADEADLMQAPREVWRGDWGRSREQFGRGRARLAREAAGKAGEAPAVAVARVLDCMETSQGLAKCGLVARPPIYPAVCFQFWRPIRPGALSIDGTPPCRRISRAFVVSRYVLAYVVLLWWPVVRTFFMRCAPCWRCLTEHVLARRRGLPQGRCL